MVCIGVLLHARVHFFFLSFFLSCLILIVKVAAIATSVHFLCAMQSWSLSETFSSVGRQVEKEPGVRWGTGGEQGESSSTAQIRWFFYSCVFAVKEACHSLVCLFPPFSLSLITEGDAQHRPQEGLINAENKARIFSICSPIRSAMHAISTVLFPPFTVFAGRT